MFSDFFPVGQLNLFLYAITLLRAYSVFYSIHQYYVSGRDSNDEAIVSYVVY